MSDSRIQLENLINTGVDTALKEVHTCLPAVVTAFNPATQLIDAQLTIKRKIDGEEKDLPKLVDVPVRFFKVLNFSFTMPIAVGDYVLIIFAERSIDQWLQDGGVQPANDIRRHSLSDAFAIPMMYDQTGVITDFNIDDAEMRSTDGLTKVAIKKTGGIKLTGDVEVAGTITATGEITGNGKALSTHNHPPGTYIDAEARAITGNSGVPN